MPRTRLRAALLVVVAAALAGIGWEVSRTVGSRHARTLADLGSDFLPTVAQHIRSFRRVKVEKGRTLWEITARDAQYFDKQDEIVVREPQMTFYLADGQRRAHVSGSEGRLVLAGRELRSLTLRGDVTVKLDDLEVQTGEATYDRARDLITSLRCSYNGDEIFSTQFYPAIAANPFVAFFAVATESGTIAFTWEGDNGFSVTEEAKIVVE